MAKDCRGKLELGKVKPLGLKGWVWLGHWFSGKAIATNHLKMFATLDKDKGLRRSRSPFQSGLVLIANFLGITHQSLDAIALFI